MLYNSIIDITLIAQATICSICPDDPFILMYAVASLTCLHIALFLDKGCSTQRQKAKPVVKGSVRDLRDHASGSVVLPRRRKIVREKPARLIVIPFYTNTHFPQPTSVAVFKMPVAVPTELQIETLVLGAGPVSRFCNLAHVFLVFSLSISDF